MSQFELNLSLTIEKLIVSKYNQEIFSHFVDIFSNTVTICYLDGRFVSGCQMVRYSNGSLKTGLKKPVCDPKCLVQQVT